MRRLTPEELDRLDHFLLDSEDRMLLSTLDGFLAGIIVCPELILPGEWLPKIWEGDSAVFADEESASEILNLIMVRYNEIVHGLERKDAYQPILDPDTAGSMLWEIWAEGLAAAMALRPDSWAAYRDAREADVRDSLRTLDAMAGQASLKTRMEKAEEEDLRETAQRRIPELLKTLHRARLRMQPAPPRAGRGIGRNDPCPCGSGRKFKKCCLN